jgi:cytochrome c-type biogenesis protein CcmH/NrfG
MGLLKLLTFPVSGPVAGMKWTLTTLLSEAERRYYDLSAIRQEMAELERQFTAGQIDEETFDAREEALFERLLEAREYHAQKAAGGAG